jgi:membrane-associated phospholipid phosphatase
VALAVAPCGAARAEAPEVPGPAFRLRPEIDLPLLGLSLVFASGRFFRSTPAYCAPLCPRENVDALDRVTAGYWSPNWQLASNIGIAALGAGAAGLLLADEGARRGFNDLLVVTEAALASNAFASVMTLAVARPRPFLYGEKAPLDQRLGGDGALSFISSHVAMSFAIATSTTVALHRLHPGSRLPWIALGVGAAGATFVAVSRVLSGMHFISDVTGGAIVGSSLGVLLPALHEGPVGVAPVVSGGWGGGAKGLALTLRY